MWRRSLPERVAGARRPPLARLGAVSYNRYVLSGASPPASETRWGVSGGVAGHLGSLFPPALAALLLPASAGDVWVRG